MMSNTHQDERSQHQQPSQSILSFISSTQFPSHLYTSNQPPILNKIQSSQTSFYCGYSTGIILQYLYPSYNNIKNTSINNTSIIQYYNDNNDKNDNKNNNMKKNNNNSNNDNNNELILNNILHPYQNMDVIDINKYSKQSLLICTHTQITLLNMVKNKRILLKGHQQTPISISSHPISPLIVSVSNLVIMHDLRMQKPILVNYITPPVYDVDFLPDGQFYFLSGQPCRIGRDKWIRTLQNGIGTVAMNSKYILTNDMNGSVTFWDWKRSQKIRIIKNISNKLQYQTIHLKAKNQLHSQILFLQDNGNLLYHDLLQNNTKRQKVLNVKLQDNWKSQISSEIDNTKHMLLYQHNKTEIKCFKVNQMTNMDKNRRQKEMQRQF